VRDGLEPYDTLVMKALAVNPADRYAKASDFAAALNQMIVERFPGYGSHELASWLRELFAWDIYEAQASGDAALRDRLLFQLTHAKVEFDPNNSTKELLRIGGVSIPPPGPIAPTITPPGEALRKARGVAVLALSMFGGLALIIGLGVHLFGAEVSGLGASAAAPGSGARDGGPTFAGPTGTLSLNSWPSAVVYLDDERLPGLTPMFNKEVLAGHHKLRFERPELGLKKELDVDVPAGGSRTVAVKLDR